MHLCTSSRYFIIFVEYWKFNTSKNSINAPSKKFVLIILHPNPSIQSPVASGVGLVAGKIAKIENRGFGSERAGFAFPAPPLRHWVNWVSQLRVGWSVWTLPWVCSAFLGSDPVIWRPQLAAGVVVADRLQKSKIGVSTGCFFYCSLRRSCITRVSLSVYRLSWNHSTSPRHSGIRIASITVPKEGSFRL